ncbi:DMT family transporter [Winogradskyella immobilis]|uniref:EamA family transporter n=1 Tax=Winogradskyella immobilis TaxID=2816852 RepID=A0ABS8EMH5_9FLAO|nr:DMT family transporter [Winogradskyella immobilis]MCC1484418.1 EamA family transporter [Winogradskyella immobilis]MCG0016510.1 DMT family transporter [Winogradskyella immobilis]
MNSHIKHVFWLTLATLFISTSGALGKFIAIPAPVLVWWRSALAAICLLAFCFYKKISLKVSVKDQLPFVISAVFMGAHWITYFYALKLSNVAIGMLSLFTFPVITALLEPAFSKVKFDPTHILLGTLVLVGIYILAPEFNIENNDLKGLLLGLLSAVCYALRTLILKQHVSKYNGTALMFYQVLILTLILSPTLYYMDTSGIKTQFPYVILLAVLTTAIGHTMFVNSLTYFKVSTASIIASAQPIFGIIIAYFFLKEIPNWNTFWGGLLIISTVIIESFRSRKQLRSNNKKY